MEVEEFKAVLAETKIMAYIGQHAHVIKLVGADVSNILNRKSSNTAKMLVKFADLCEGYDYAR